MRLKIIICLLLGGITLAIYWPTRHFETINLDDPGFINPDWPLELNWRGLEKAMTAVVVANWHPVTNLSFLLMHGCFGFNAGAEHLVNALFHTANSVLLFLVLLRLTGAVWRSAAVGAIFAWHPLRVESVAWISERKDVLYVFFMLLSLLCYINYAQNKASPATTTKAWPLRLNYFLALLFFILSFMSKGTVVTLPFLLLLLDFWPLQRLNRSTVQPLLIEKIPFFALTIFFSALTFWIHKAHADVTSLGQFGLGERIENAILSYVYYLGQFFWPADLAVPYTYPTSFDIDQVFMAALLLLGISVLCIRQLWRRPYLAVGWFWYLGTLVPVIGLIQVGQQGMADRHTYVPLIGPVLSLVWLISEWAGAIFFRKILAASMAIIILGTCIILTRMQMSYWQNPTRLFERTIAVTPENFLAEYCLASQLKNEGLWRKAAVQFRIVIALGPDDYLGHYQLAECLNTEGYRREALEEYQTAVSDDCNPDDYFGDLNLVDSLIKLGRSAEATPYMESVLRLNPDSVQGLDNLAWLLATCPDASVRNGPRAVALSEHACELTHYQQTRAIGTLAAAYAEAGRFDDAVTTAQKAIANAQKNGETDLAQRNQELLKLYVTHQPYHEPAK